MNAVSLPTDAEPAAIVADFERRAQRFETPCGDGALVWRAWGSGPPLLFARELGVSSLSLAKSLCAD